jgi:hypothetical protein
MIDKSIRQHYQTGEKVNPFRRGMETIMPKVKQKFFPQDKTGLDEKQLLKNVAGSAAKNLVTRKLATQLGGTGLLSSLGPIGALLAMFLARKGVGKGQDYLTQKGGALEAFQTGFGSPQEGRELRKLERRRQYMLQRKEEGKNYSEKNLDIVTRAIAEAKGLDINNPNEMRNIDKPIQQIQIEKRVTEPQIIPETPEIKSPFAKPIPKTPDVIIPHDTDPIITKPVYVPPVLKERHPDIPAPRAPISVPVPTHISGGGGRDQPGSMPTGTGGRNPWGRAKGGRVDKALGGRVRDI